MGNIIASNIFLWLVASTIYFKLSETFVQWIPFVGLNFLIYKIGMTMCPLPSLALSAFILVSGQRPALLILPEDSEKGASTTYSTGIWYQEIPS